MDRATSKIIIRRIVDDRTHGGYERFRSIVVARWIRRSRLVQDLASVLRWLCTSEDIDPTLAFGIYRAII